VVVGVGEVVLFVGAVLISAFLQSTVGFGFSLLAVPVLAVTMPTKEAVVVCGALSLAIAGAQAIGERAHGDRPVMGRMVAGVVVGAPIGLLVLTVTTGRQLRFLLGAVILVYVVVTLRGVALRRTSAGVDVGAGVAAGALNTALSANGPAVIMALHPRHLSPPAFRATVAGVFAVSNVIAVSLYAATGRYGRDSLLLVAWGLPLLAAGYLLGATQRRRVRPERHRSFVLGLLALTGVMSLVGAILA
jgi:uncharacterized membrane protein YfcA